MTLCLNDHWQPSSATRLKLKQWGFSKGRVVDLLRRYKASANHYCDNRFMAFCTQQAEDIVCDVLSVRQQWRPSQAAIRFLIEAGVPSECILNKYIPYFFSDYADKKVVEASWDRAFIQFAIRCWRRDPINPNAKFARPIPPDWLPCDDALVKLSVTGVSQQRLTAKALEFRLYWRDAGGYKLDWDEAFVQWVMRGS